MNYSNGKKWWFVKMCFEFFLERLPCTWTVTVHANLRQFKCMCILLFCPGEDPSLLKDREYHQAIQIWQDFYEEYVCSRSWKWYWILCANPAVIFKPRFKLAGSAVEMLRKWLHHKLHLLDSVCFPRKTSLWCIHDSLFATPAQNYGLHLNTCLG